MGRVCCSKLDTQIGIEGLSLLRAYSDTSDDLQSLMDSKQSCKNSRKLSYLLQTYASNPQRCSRILNCITSIKERSTSNIITLSLKLFRLNSSDLNFLGDLFLYLPNLSCLNLWKCGLGKIGIRYFTDSLMSIRDLRSLNIQDNHIDHTMCPDIARALLFAPKLQEFWVSVNSIGDVGLACLVKSFQNMKWVENMGLGENNLTLEGIKELVLNTAHMKYLSKVDLGVLSQESKKWILEDESCRKFTFR